MTATKTRSPLLRLLFVGLTLPASATAADMSPPDLVDLLRDGGYVIYVRHAQTEADYADQVTADPLDCSTQRVLSRTGWAQAKQIGAGFERLGIPVGDVVTSQYCRAWQTADLAFGQMREDAALNFEPAEDYTEAQMAAMRDRVAPLITAPLENGMNRVIVGHDDPFEAVTGVYPEPQGVTYVLSVEGTSIEVLGAIPPDAWSGL